MESSWHRVAKLSDVAEGEVVAANMGDTPLALCRIDGKVYAFDDVCPHGGAGG